MGDVAITLPVLVALSNQYPVGLHVLTKRSFFPLFRQIPNIKLIAVDDYKTSEQLKNLAEKLKTEIDFVADLNHVLISQILAGFFKTTAKVSHINYFQKKPMVEKYNDVFTALGFPIGIEKCEFIERPGLPKTVLPFIPSGKKIIGFAPTASQHFKKMPNKRVHEIIAALKPAPPLGAGGLQIYLFGHKTETILNELAQQYPHVLNIAGKLTFEEELALISRLDVMLSADSGNGHLAANYGVPVLTFWEGTTPENGYRPFKQPEENSIYPETNIDEIIKKIWNFL